MKTGGETIDDRQVRRVEWMKVKFNYTVYFAKPSWPYRRVDAHNRRGAIDRYTTPNMMHHDT